MNKKGHRIAERNHLDAEIDLKDRIGKIIMEEFDPEHKLQGMECFSLAQKALRAAKRIMGEHLI